MIPFNRPFAVGNELEYIAEAMASGHISGNGSFTGRCHAFFEERYGFPKVLLTTSCTAALEMCAILLGIQPGDEVIMPSYAFVSTANAFALRGARIVFADSSHEHPNISADAIEALVTSRTKAVVVVHYAGNGCEMDRILNIALRYDLALIEDAAQAIDSHYGGRPLGSLGTMATFSFHETKNITSGEGGLLVVNDAHHLERCEVIWNKGTNRNAFCRGEIDKYSWVDVGSSFAATEIVAAYLYAQLEHVDAIQSRRKELWQRYAHNLTARIADFGVTLPLIPPWSDNNWHIFYLVCRSKAQRDALIEGLRQDGIMAVFHYVPLHSSPFFERQHDGRALLNCDRFADCLVRMPLFFELTNDQVDFVCERILVNLSKAQSNNNEF